METIPEHGIYVAGRWIRTDRTDPIDNPATGEVFARVTRAEDVHLAEAFRKAADAAPKWADIMVEERAGFLVGAFDLVFEKRHEIARLISQEQGKPFAEAMTLEIIPSLDMLRYYASKAPLFLAPDKTPFHQPWFTAKESRVVFAPLGVVAALTPSFSPWIAPFMSACLALVAGNAIILKPSDKTPLCGLKVAEIFDELGLPDGLLSVLHGDDTFGAKVADLSVAAVTFIGSRESGAKIATQCCSSFKKSIVECGGKNPLVVLDDADLDLSAEAAIWGAFANNGQYHANTERVLIHENVADEWVKRAAAHLAKLHIGDPLADDTDLGPMISTEQHQMLDRLIAEATASGARMAARLPVPNGLSANFYSPAILTRVKSSMSIIREPYDGPVMTVETFRDDAEVIALANDTIYGLSASIWSLNEKRAGEIAAKLQFGNIWVNDVVFAFEIPHAPWGGNKQSGHGQIQSPYGLLEYVFLKHVGFDPPATPAKEYYFQYDRDLRVYIEYVLDSLKAGNPLTRYLYKMKIRDLSRTRQFLKP